MSRLQSYLDKKGPPTLDSVVRRIDEISTLPHIALQVMEVANEPGSSAADLKDVVEGDAALSARILRCVNSSAYGTRTKVTNLQHAIAYLGLKQIRNLAITASVSELFKKEEAVGSYLRSHLWRHLVSVGICARLIAMRRQFENFEDVFLAGLLHDATGSLLSIAKLLTEVRSSTRIQHLLAEQDTLRTSYAKAVSTAIEEREERLLEDSRSVLHHEGSGARHRARIGDCPRRRGRETWRYTLFRYGTRPGNDFHRSPSNSARTIA